MARNTQYKSRVGRSGYGPSSTGMGDGLSGDGSYGIGVGNLKDSRARRDLSGSYAGSYERERDGYDSGGSNRMSSRYEKNAFGGGLSVKQIVIFWAVTLVMMLVVFVSGYQAGKYEGAREVLDQAGQHMVRLPIARPAASFLNKEANDNEPDKGAASTTLPEGSVAAPVEQEPVAKIPAADVKPASGVGSSTDQKIDFTRAESLPLKAQVVKPDSALTNIKIKESEKPKPVYEEVYPGKKLFPPPGGARAEKDDASDAAQVLPFKVDPLAEKPIVEKFVEPVKETPLAPVSGWYLQVSASPTKEDALNVVNRLKAKNLPVRMEEAPIKNQKYYRILVGPYLDRGEAIKQRIEAKSASGVSAEPFIRQVK